MKKFEKKHVFGEGVRPMDTYQKNEEMRKKIYFEIRKLNQTLGARTVGSQHARTIEKFIDCLIPSVVDGGDPGKLPVYAKRPAAPVSDKAMCVFYLVSCLIQSYWDYCKDESADNYIKVSDGFDVLHQINKDYKNMHVTGDVREGYILEL
jgi:hypothetical protein